MVNVKKREDGKGKETVNREGRRKRGRERREVGERRGEGRGGVGWGRLVGLTIHT